jgi:hypothetical protein
MRHADGWRDLARPTIVAGSLLVAVLVAYVAFDGKPGGGYLQRAAIVLVSAGRVALALRVRALAPSRTDAAESTIGLHMDRGPVTPDSP